MEKVNDRCKLKDAMPPAAPQGPSHKRCTNTKTTQAYAIVGQRLSGTGNKVAGEVNTCASTRPRYRAIRQFVSDVMQRPETPKKLKAEVKDLISGFSSAPTKLAKQQVPQIEHRGHHIQMVS